MYEMLEENFLVPFDEDERIISYHPIRPIHIFVTGLNQQIVSSISQKN